MQLPETPAHKTLCWDAYKAFHYGIATYGVAGTGNYNLPPFVVFTTGEVICTTPNPDRVKYHHLNVEVVATADDRCPTLVTPDGLEVKKTWLDVNGMQTLLIDYDTKRVVRLDTTIPSELDTRPARFRDDGRLVRSRAYFPGPGLPPVGGPVRLSASWRTALTTDDEKAHIKAMMHQAKTLLGVEGQYNGDAHSLSCRLTQLVSAPDILALRDTMGVSEFLGLAQGNISPKIVTYPYLLLAD